MTGESPAAGGFPATRHSVIVAMRHPDRGERARAYDRLIAGYWRPTYKYLRWKWRADHARAQDLTQGFFLAALEKDFLPAYDPARSRFRSFLRLCLDRWVGKELRAGGRMKRGGGFEHLSLDFEDAAAEWRRLEVPDEGADPDAFFQREWLRSLLADAVEALRADCEARGQAVRFTVFSRYELEGEKPTYAALAGELGVPVTKITNDLHAARKRFRTLLLERLRSLCADEAEYQAEARALLGGDA